MGDSGGISLNLTAAEPVKEVKEKVSVFAHNNNAEEILKDKEVKKKDGGGEKEEVDREVISSLFGHNPEIPSLELGEVNPVQEDVFSARTFAELNLNSHLVQNLKHHGITTLTNIQSKVS